MLGLMGTLNPGLSALGIGDISILTTAMTVSFDTRIIGFVLGRMRRRWYDNAMQSLDDEVHHTLSTIDSKTCIETLVAKSA